MYKKTSFYWDAFSCKLVCCYKKYHSVLFGTIQNKNCCQQTLKVIKYPVNMRFSGSILLYYAQDKPASGRRLCSVWESDRRLEVVNRIAETATDYEDRPLEDQVMQTVTVDTFGVDYPEPEKL